MATYAVWVDATSNSTPGTEDVFIELRANASYEFGVKRIRCFYGSQGTSPEAVGDNNVSGRLIYVATGTGGSGTSFTPIPQRPTMPAATTACTVKNGATALALGGTPTESGKRFEFNERGFYEWIPRGPEEFVWSGKGGVMELVLQNSVASRVLLAGVEIEE